MKTLRSVGRWMTDWRNGATLAASIVAVVVLLTTVDAIAGRREAFESLRASRSAASRRIDLLQARIDQLVAEGQADSAEVSKLATEVDVLRRQVEGLGATPVVTRGAAAGAARSTPAAAPTAAGATPATTTTTAPPGPAGTSPPTTQPTPDPGPGAPPAPPPSDPPPVCRLLAVPVICD